jgi:hypothetical protein
MAPKKKKQPKQECVYCVVNPATTGDHVPPKNIFPDPKPSTLVTVPACGRCNMDFQKDEEYFLAVINFTQAGLSSAGKQLWDQRLSRMYRRSPGFRRLIGNSFRRSQVVTPAGLYLGNRLSIEPDWKRIENFFIKIVRGLYYFEYQEPLPRSALIRFAMLDDREMIETVVKNVVTGKRSWSGIFEYKRNRLPAPSYESLWLFLIYDTHLFGVATYEQ